MLEEPARKRWSRAPRGASAGPRRRRWAPKAWRWPSTTSMLRRRWAGAGGCARAGPGARQPGAEALRQCGARAVACAGDVATPEGARQVVQAALEQLGGLHILVN